jgi:nicotinate dehydrogenase subunit B
MRRREFITVIASAIASPCAARAQQAGKLPTIGYLGDDALSWSPWTDRFVERLRELGWSDGQNVSIEYRWSKGRPERIGEIAAEFVQQNVNIIVTYGAAVAGLKQATTTIPIVFAIAVDPVGSGIVASLSHPGGNVTGVPADDTIAPGNIFQNSNIPYKFANIKAVCHRLETTPLRPSWIRTPGRMQNTFANESFIDEIAAAANADPIDFRLKYVDPADLRGIEVLNRVAAIAKWDKRPSPSKNQAGDVVTGRGVSYCKYELVRTYIAVIAEVEVKRSTGEIRATRFCVAHDCGQIINPDGVRNQIEGNVIQTVSRTLKEELKFSHSAVTSLDWASYPILTFPEMPEIVIELIDHPSDKPWGTGEPSAAVVPSAISNAVFDATGVRLRSVPFTPEKVRETLRRGA